VKKFLKLASAIVMILFAMGWVIYSYARTRPGAVANNGVSDEMPPIPESVQKKIEARREQGSRFSRENPPSPEDREKMRAEFEKQLTPEEKREMEKARSQREHSMQTTKAALSEEEQQRFGQKMRERGGPGGRRGGPRGGPGGRPSDAPPGGPRP